MSLFSGSLFTGPFKIWQKLKILGRFFEKITPLTLFDLLASQVGLLRGVIRIYLGNIQKTQRFCPNFAPRSTLRAKLWPKNTSEPHLAILGARLMVSRSVFQPFENPDFATFIYIYLKISTCRYFRDQGSLGPLKFVKS